MSMREEKRREIYSNMKKKGRIFRAHNRWGISYAHLYVAIQESGYSEYGVISNIIGGMIDEGYIRPARNVWGKTLGKDGKSSYSGNYIIEKWIS